MRYVMSENALHVPFLRIDCGMAKDEASNITIDRTASRV